MMDKLADETGRKELLKALVLFLRNFHSNFPDLQARLADYVETCNADSLPELAPLRQEICLLLERMDGYADDDTLSVHHGIPLEDRDRLVRSLSRDIAHLHLAKGKTVTKRPSFERVNATGEAFLSQMRKDLADESAVLDALVYARA